MSLSILWRHESSSRDWYAVQPLPAVSPWSTTQPGLRDSDRFYGTEGTNGLDIIKSRIDSVCLVLTSQPAGQPLLFSAFCGSDGFFGSCLHIRTSRMRDSPSKWSLLYQTSDPISSFFVRFEIVNQIPLQAKMYVNKPFQQWVVLAASVVLSAPLHYSPFPPQHQRPAFVLVTRSLSPGHHLSSNHLSNYTATIKSNVCHSIL